MAQYTFLLPAYKSKFFEEALKSIKNQTFTDFECIVSDDCSPEDLKSIFDNTVGNDPRFSYRRNKVNIGGKFLVSHWNLLVDLCQTEFLIMSSDDDVYEQNFLSEMFLLVNKYPTINLFRARAKQIDNHGLCIKEDFFASEFETHIQYLYGLFNEAKIHCIGNYIFNTNHLKENKGFLYFPFAWFSDDATAIANSRLGVVNSGRILFQFRCSTINISYQNNVNLNQSKNKIKASCNFYDWFCENEKNQLVDDSILHQNMMLSITSNVKRHVRWHFEANYRFLNWSSFYGLYSWMRAKGFFCGNIDRLLHLYIWANNWQIRRK